MNDYFEALNCRPKIGVALKLNKYKAIHILYEFETQISPY